jgi:hypothetical protein
MLKPITPIKTDGSTIFSRAYASGTISYLQATIGASTFTVSLEYDGVGGSGQATDR